MRKCRFPWVTPVLAAVLLALAPLPGDAGDPGPGSPRKAPEKPKQDLSRASAVMASSPSEVRVEGDWLVRHLPAEPATLNPITATDVYEGTVNGFVYESLLERDNETTELVGLLAERWEVSPDKLTYTFTLRPGLFWQDGKPLTSRDVVFTFRTAKDPKVDAPHLQNYYKDLVSVEAVDERRIRFTYSHPYFKALDIIGGLSVLPEHVFGQGDFNTHPAGRAPLGSGSYRFMKWDTGKEIVLARHERYWGKKPAPAKIVFKIITDETVALAVLKRRELDLMALTPVQWMKQTDTRKFGEEFAKMRYYLPGYSYIGWNSRRPFFSDKRVRRALTQLLDRDSILRNIRYGFGRTVSGPFFYESPEYDKTIAPWPYDPAAAQILLDEAGWTDHDGDGIRDKDGIPFRFEFTYSAGSTFAEQISTILKESARKAGIEVSIRPLEWATFIKFLDERSYDAATLGWSLPVEDDPYQVWHSSQAEKGSNYVDFRNPAADLIIEEARTSFDRKKRIELYHRFHRILHEEQPYTFLFVSESLVAVDRRFEGVRVYKLGLDPREWWVPAERQRYK